MPSKFVGFDSNTGPNNERDRRLTGVPGAFFTQLLPQITNPNELKTLLYFMFLAGQKRGEPKWVGYWELAEASELLTGLRKGGDPRPAIEHLREALELCMARGSLIRVEAAPPPPEFFGNAPAKGDLEPVTVTWFLLNTSGNREFLASLEKGEIQIEETSLLVGVDLWDKPLPDAAASGESPRGSALAEIQKWNKQKQWRVRSSRPDIYTLYEQNIGALTPILSERLREAEGLYPAIWIEEAFAEAVNYNKRSWAYIIKILENWVTDGRKPNERPTNQPRTKPNQQSNAVPNRTGRSGGTGMAGDGVAAPATAPGKTNVSPGGSSSPNNRRGPIDFTKYTTGKYAHLTEPNRKD